MNEFSAEVQWAGMTTADPRGDLRRAIEREKWLRTDEGREWARRRDEHNQRELQWFMDMWARPSIMNKAPMRGLKGRGLGFSTLYEAGYDLGVGPDKSFATFYCDGVIDQIIPNPRDLLSFGGEAWGMTKSAVDQRGQIHYTDRRDSIDDPKGSEFRSEFGDDWLPNMIAKEMDNLYDRFGWPKDK